MTLDQLMAKVNEKYPDGLIELYFKFPNEEHGDTLAEFIVLELRETFDPGASDQEQLDQASTALTCAVNELETIISGLNIDWVGQLMSDDTRPTPDKRW